MFSVQTQFGGVTETPLTAHMCIVAELSPKPILSLLPPSGEANADDNTDKSSSGTSVQPVNQPKAPTDPKSKKKRITPSSKPKTSKLVRKLSSTKQVTESQPAEEPVATADTTHSLDASESAEKQGNQPKIVVAKNGEVKGYPQPTIKSESVLNTPNLVYTMCLHLGNDTSANGDPLLHYKFTLSTSKFMYAHDYNVEEEVKEEDESPYDIESEIRVVKSPYDIESEIRVVKRFQPPQMEDEDHITFLGPVDDAMETALTMFEVKTVYGFAVKEEVKLDKADFDLVSIPDDTIESVDGFDATDSDIDDNIHSKPKDNLSKSEEAGLDTSTDKTTDTEPLCHLRKETSSLSTKVHQLESSITQQVADKLEESIPSLVEETLKATLPGLLSGSLKTVMPQMIAESMQVRKGMEEVSSKVNYYAERLDKNDLHTKEQVDLIKDMVHLLDSAQAFRKANAKGENFEQAPPIIEQVSPDSTALVVYASKEKDSEEKVSDEEPPSKRIMFLIPNPITSSLNLLSLILPQNISLEQFTDNLFQTTSFEYSLTPHRNENKGKGIATKEEPVKHLMPLIEQGGLDPKMLNLQQFSISGKNMTLKDAQAQLTEMKRLDDLKAKKEKTKHKLKALSNEELEAQAAQLAAYEAKRKRMLEEYN
ncbi:hypothetical protein Tco_0680128 [Tanacetum coccineum]|uniref:Uncharacterized protein n=1 Tax=Tanacetum coccineum TaxID=301880 RepID=A0ABQ4XJZ0_9ASTR